MYKTAIGSLLAVLCLNAQPHQTGTVRHFPDCSTGRSYFTIEGWNATFQFPKIPGLKASSQGRDIDYAVRFYFVRTVQGRQGIQHGTGPSWSFGKPSALDIKKSVKYEEITYENAGQEIIDAR